MMVLGFGVLGDPAHCLDPFEEGRELDGAAQSTVGVLPAIERRGGGFHLFIG